MQHRLSDKLLATAPRAPWLWRTAMARAAARRGMGAVALAAGPSDPTVLLDLGMYASAARTRNPAARMIGMAGLGRIEEARGLLDQLFDVDGDARMRLARAAAPSDPAWALDLLNEEAFEARAACLLALGRPDEAEAVIRHADPGRETTVLTAAAHTALGRFGQARQALNRLFAADDLESPLAMNEDALGLTAFEAEVPRLSGERPLVSVVIAAKNAAATIDTAIRSLQRQSWPNLEIIVVEDGSTDDMAARVGRLAAIDPRVILIANVRSPGAYGARNTGLDRAKGAYIAFHDADDWAHPRRIERQVEPLQRSAGSICSYFRIGDDGRIVNPRVFPLLRKNPILLMLRRDALERIGSFEEVHLGGDSEYVARLDDQIGRWSVARMPQCLVVARWNAASLMGSPETGLSPAGLAKRVAYVEDWRRRHVVSLS